MAVSSAEYVQILQVLAAPIPGEVTSLIGGCLSGSSLGTVYSTIGLRIGSWMVFVLAIFFGLPLVEKAVKPSIIEKYDYSLKQLHCHSDKIYTTTIGNKHTSRPTTKTDTRPHIL